MKSYQIYHYKNDLFYFKRFFYLLINVLIILKAIFVYIKDLLYLKDFGTECAPYVRFSYRFLKG